MISKFKSITKSKLSWVIVALIAIPFVFGEWEMYLQEVTLIMLQK